MPFIVIYFGHISFVIGVIGLILVALGSLYNGER